MRFVKLNLESIFSVKVSSIDEILKKYSSVFTTGKIGLMKEFQAHIELKEGAIPKFHMARPVSYAPQEGFEKELDRLETAGVMRKVERSDWASPIVVVPKADGKEHGNADLMSRAPFEEAKCDTRAEVNYFSHTSELPITAKVIADSTRKDKVLACVLKCTLSRWPEDMKDDRTTSHAVTGLSPAQFLKQSVRTRLTVIKPSLQDHLQDKQLKDKEYHDQRVPKLREFVKNECVCVKNC